MGYYELARAARIEVRKANGEEKTMWKARLRDLGIRVGNALVEMGDLEGAARHLKTLRGHGVETEEDRSMHSRLALIYLRIGDVAAARGYAEQSQRSQAGNTATSVLRPLLSMTEGQYDAAVEEWRELRDASSEQNTAMNTQNLAVCLLYTGRLNEVDRPPLLLRPGSRANCKIAGSQASRIPSRRRPFFSWSHLQSFHNLRAFH